MSMIIWGSHKADGATCREIRAHVLLAGVDMYFAGVQGTSAACNRTAGTVAISAVFIHTQIHFLAFICWKKHMC